MEDLLQVGIITYTHGVRGEVKVYPTTDDPRRFRRLKEVVLDTGKEKMNLERMSGLISMQSVRCSFRKE